MNSPFPIHNEADYRRAIALIDQLWDADPGSADAATMDIMATLVEVYEKANRNLPPADPLALIQFKLREIGWSQRELARQMGWGSGRVSELLSGKRPLTLRMVQDLSKALRLPAGLLVPHVPQEEPDRVWVQLPQSLVTRIAAPEGQTLDQQVQTLLQQALAPSACPEQVSGPRKRSLVYSQAPGASRPERVAA
jgi:HTH-type transcriptional regulator/antitoxin HigA